MPSGSLAIAAQRASAARAWSIEERADPVNAHWRVSACGRGASIDTAPADGLYCKRRMVTVAQSAERQIVDLEVAGSSPVGHPTHPHDAPKAHDIRLAGHRVVSGMAYAARDGSWTVPAHDSRGGSAIASGRRKERGHAYLRRAVPLH